MAAIEFALVANAFILVLAGIGGLGIYMSAHHSLQQIAAESARKALAGVTISEQTDLANAYIDEFGPSYPFLQAEHLESSVSHPSTSVVSVTITYDGTKLPIISMLTSINVPVGDISASSTIRLGN